jgi:hypothetical protein
MNRIMKASNLILTALFSLILLVILSSSFILKSEYEKIDKSDPLYGYEKRDLPAFKYVHLHGKAFGLTEIHPGKESEIRMIANPKYIEWKVTGDTLTVTYKRDWHEGNLPPDYAFNNIPSFYIVTPELRGITSQKVMCKVKGWKSMDLIVKQEGGAMQFSQNQFDNLQALVSSGGIAKMDGKNSIKKTALEIRDSSSLLIDKNIFTSFDLKIDSTAKISLPGEMLNKISHF